jgi:hypothetical protein
MSMPSNNTPQQIHASNVSMNISEAMEARVKDPLWFLSRQWQTGEFEAENGGRPINMSVSSKDYAFTSVSMMSETQSIVNGKKLVSKPLKQSDLLECIIEAETSAGDAPAWRTEALEYSFNLDCQGHQFKVKEYNGKNLDWYHFESSSIAKPPVVPVTTKRIIPNQLHFAGAPDPRWWRLEDGSSYFDSPNDPEPNALSMILPEFFYTDVKNWYTAPMLMTSGSLREVTNVNVVDSFGIVTNLEPATSKNNTADWGMFVVDGASKFDGRYILAPNIALDILHNDEVEEVRFARDEDANLVWATENRISENGLSFMPESEIIGDAGTLSATHKTFKLKSPTERSWIPYVPRQIQRDGVNNVTVMRRARTDESATLNNPQFRSQIVKESTHINEEEIPSTGIKIRRVHRYTRDSEGKPHFWIGREKDISERNTRPGIKFDYLEDKLV